MNRDFQAIHKICMDRSCRAKWVGDIPEYVNITEDEFDMLAKMFGRLHGWRELPRLDGVVLLVAH